MAGLQEGQAYGVSHRPGFGLLGSVPRSLSTQPPFVTPALNGCMPQCSCDLSWMYAIIIVVPLIYHGRMP